MTRHTTKRAPRIRESRVEPARHGHRLYSCGDLVLDVDTRTVSLGEHILMPTYVQFEMLLRLLEDPGRVLSREELAVLPHTAPRAVDIQISRLRKQLSSARRFVIDTVPRVGYRCRDLPEERAPA